MSTINSRINEIIEDLFEGNNTKFALFLGTSEANVRNYRTKTSPKIEIITKICEKLEINYEWMLTGKGERTKNNTESLKSENKKEASKIEDKKRIELLEEEVQEHLKTIESQSRAINTLSKKILNSNKGRPDLHINTTG